MLRIGWFATGRGEGSQKLLRAAIDAIEAGVLDARISFVFSNREPGTYEATDNFFSQVKSYGIPLVTLSDSRFRKERGGEVARAGKPIPAWRREYDEKVVDLLAPYEWDVGMLAGYYLITTEPLYSLRPLLNLHPAAPDQPAGTWQQVTWQLIERRVDHGGIRIHLVTAGLDEGPIVTYCTYPLRGPGIDDLWRSIEGRSTEEIQQAEGEAHPLFQEMRRRGVAREIPLLVETLRALADGRLSLPRDAGVTGVEIEPRDLTTDIEAALAKAALA